MTHLILWLALTFLAAVAAVSGACSWPAAAIWTVSSLVALGLHSMFGEEA